MTEVMTGGDERVRLAAETLCGRIGGVVPETALVLGSGLGGFADRIEPPRVVLPTSDIPGWPQPGVAGHAGTLVAGTLAGRPVLAASGRVHLYEGWSAADVTFGVRVLATAGVSTIILTNAAGGIDPALLPGTLMVIDDHINLTGTNPLVGPNDERLGPRFPDMSEVYSTRLRLVADRASAALGMAPAHGVYAGVLGPSYETPAEVRALGRLGATAVGMSTVCEAIAARHMGLDVIGLSCITNPAAGLGDQPLREEDVNLTAGRAAGDFARLLEAIVARL